MNKLEPNMYIRTKEGKIDKVLEINTEDFDEPVVRLASYPIEMYQGMFEYEKASHNLIDLIEKNDFVNGKRVSCKIDKYIYLEDEIRVSSKQIKSIVTKEQFSQMEYKVGE